MVRKGISPILASVLLLAVTLSVAGVFSGWAPDIAKKVTDQTTNNTEHQLNCNKASAELISATYNSSGNDVAITLRNNGREDLSNLILAAFDSNDGLMDQTVNVSADSGTLINDSISSLSSKPASIQLYSETCGDVTDELEEINQ